MQKYKINTLSELFSEVAEVLKEGDFICLAIFNKNRINAPLELKKKARGIIEKRLGGKHMTYGQWVRANHPPAIELFDSRNYIEWYKQCLLGRKAWCESLAKEFKGQ